MTLRARLVLVLTIFLVGSSFSSAFLTYKMFKHWLYRGFDNFLIDKLRYYSTVCIADGSQVKFVFPEETFRNFAALEDPDYFQFCDEKGETLLRSENLGDKRLPLPDWGMDRVFKDFALPSGKPGRFAYLKFRVGGGNGPLIHLTLANDLDDIYTSLAYCRNWLLVCQFLVTAAMLIVALWVVSRGLRPLNKLGEQIDQTEIGAAGNRFELQNAPGELIPVVDRLNQLMIRVETAIRHERQFTNNAAHELRTPLATMQAQIEGSLSKSRTAQEFRRALEDVLTSHEHLEFLVRQMLLLSRLEAGNFSSKSEVIDLGQLLKTCWKRAFAIAEERNITVNWEVPNPLPDCNANSLLLETILGNLFENAVCYSPSGNTVRIAILKQVGGLRFQVENANPGLKEGDLEQLFQPFWRKSQSVSERSHAGIGLSLCERIAQAFKTKMEVSLEGEGIVFEFYLPQPV